MICNYMQSINIAKGRVELCLWALHVSSHRRLWAGSTAPSVVSPADSSGLARSPPSSGPRPPLSAVAPSCAGGTPLSYCIIHTKIFVWHWGTKRTAFRGFPGCEQKRLLQWIIWSPLCSWSRASITNRRLDDFFLKEGLWLFTLLYKYWYAFI